MNTKKRAYLYLLINAILWGVGTSFIKQGIEHIHPFTFLFYRYLIVCIFTLIYLVVYKKFKEAWLLIKTPQSLLAMLFCGPLPLIFLYLGIQKTTAFIAATSSAITPLIAAFLGVYLLKEQISKSEKLGTLIALTGIVSLVFLQNGYETTSITSQMLGILLYLISMFVWVLGGIFYKKIDEKLQDTASITSFLPSLIIFGILFLFTNDTYTLNMFDYPKESVFGILYMAIPGTLIAFLAYQKAQKEIEVSEANVFTYLQAVFGIPASIILTNTKFKPLFIPALLLIVIGIWLNIKEKFHKKS